MAEALIIVCVKQVPAPGPVKLDPQTNNLVRGNGVMNPFDRHALEAALRLKETRGARIVALSMGPAQFSESLHEACARGADEAILLSSPAFAGSDTLATAYVLAQAIGKIGRPALVLCGRHAIDADTGQVGPLLADCLDMPQVTFAVDIQWPEAESIVAVRLLEGYEQVVRVKLPALISVNREMNQPRYPLPARIVQAARMDITVWNERDIDCDPARIGQAGSPTLVKRIFTQPKSRERAQMLAAGSARESAQDIVRILARRNIL